MRKTAREESRRSRTGSGSALTILVFAAMLLGSCVGPLAAGEDEDRTLDQLAQEFMTPPDSGPQRKEIIKSSFYLPMKDGTRLAVDLLLPPKTNPVSRHPTLLVFHRFFRSERGARPGAIEKFFVSNNYAVVNVDLRGSGASFGIRKTLHPAEDIRDGREILDWISSRSWSSGAIAVMGEGFSGTTAELLALSHPEALRAVITRFGEYDLFLEFTHPGGLLNVGGTSLWEEKAGLRDSNTGIQVSPVDGDDGDTLLRKILTDRRSPFDLENSVSSLVYRDDETQGFNPGREGPSHFERKGDGPHVPILHWGSWIDGATTQGVLRRFKGPRSPQIAIIGSWAGNGKYGLLSADGLWPAPETEYLVQLEICLRFLNHYLREPEDEWPYENLLFYSTLGEETWNATRTWPPEPGGERTYFVSQDFLLTEEEPGEADERDGYQVDFGVSTEENNRWLSRIDDSQIDYGDRDAADYALMTYTTLPLEEDLLITGSPRVTLFVESTAKDGSLIVYLDKVDHNGKSSYVTEGVLRLLHRQSTSEDPEGLVQRRFLEEDGRPIEPGELIEVQIQLLPTSVLLRKEEQLRIGIAGHDEGTFLRVPGEGDPLLSLARTKKHASRLVLQVGSRRAK